MDNTFTMNSLLRALQDHGRTPTDREIDTAMWLKDPSAFWLHPEGPLSDTTPEEWLAKQPPLGEPPKPPMRGVRIIHLLPGESITEVNPNDILIASYN